MFGEAWSKGSPEKMSPWPGRYRQFRRAMRRTPLRVHDRHYPRGYRKPENAPRGRMSAYAFFIQTCREEFKQSNPGENIVFKDFSKKCAERWRSLNEVERQHFNDMAAQDRARYAKELESYSGPRIRNRKRKHRKDPRAPKRALSAFFWFCADERPKLRANNPTAGVGKVAKELGMMWSNSDEATKEKYTQMAIKDKERYDEQMGEYKKGNFQRYVEGMEDLPPPDPTRNGKIPNKRKYNFPSPRNYRDYIGHTIGVGGGEGSSEAGPSNASDEDDDFFGDEDELASDDDMDEEHDEEILEHDIISTAAPGQMIQQHHHAQLMHQITTQQQQQQQQPQLQQQQQPQLQQQQQQQQQQQPQLQQQQQQPQLQLSAPQLPPQLQPPQQVLAPQHHGAPHMQ